MEKFATWAAVLEFVRAGGWLWYHAPMDLRPASVRVVKVYKNGKLRIDPGTPDADCFTADAKHLDRMRRQSPGAPLLKDRQGEIVPGDEAWRRAAENAAIVTLNRDSDHNMSWQGYGECCRCGLSARVTLDPGRGWTVAGDAAGERCRVGAS